MAATNLEFPKCKIRRQTHIEMGNPPHQTLPTENRNVHHIFCRQQYYHSFRHINVGRAHKAINIVARQHKQNSTVVRSPVVKRQLNNLHRLLFLFARLYRRQQVGYTSLAHIQTSTLITIQSPASAVPLAPLQRTTSRSHLTLTDDALLLTFCGINRSAIVN